MKPFNLEAAKRGEPIVTRNGRKAKFVAHVTEAECEKIVVLIDGVFACFYEGGKYYSDMEGSADLFMAPPPMRSINGYEYPEPVREPLEGGQEYWIAAPSDDILFMRSSWDDTEMEFVWLKRGLIHLTREAAEAHARAIILAGGGEA